MKLFVSMIDIDANKVFCLMGPTASGKSSLALKLANYFPLEVISVDSAMVYRGMDIGTAKPNLEELQSVPHHLIDICDPGEIYSAGEFRRDALIKIAEIFARGKIPLLVGGTMMYFYVLQQGIADLPKSDKKTREKIKKEKEQFGLAYLFDRLCKIDPEGVKDLKSTDSQRIQRALEVYEITGKTLTEFKSQVSSDVPPYEFVNIVIAPLDRNDLNEKINFRFQEMLRLGFIDEVKSLYQRGDLTLDLPSMRTVGYREIWQYLSKQISYEKMLESVPITTGKLAKRQLTWLRNRFSDAFWFNNEDSLLLSKVKDCMG